MTTARWLADACGAVVDRNVRSVILHGSLTLDDFVPGRSDIDLLMVVADPLSPAEVDALVAIVREADLGAAGGVDLHVVTATVARAPSREPALELHVGRYPGVALEVHVGEVGPDLLPELSMARAHGRSLRGAAPVDALGPVPPDWIRERGAHWVRTWLSLADDTTHAEFMVVSACRIWRFGVEEVHCSKTDAARWALERDGSLTAVQQALHHRTVDPDSLIDPDAILALLRTVLAELTPTETFGSRPRPDPA